MIRTYCSYSRIRQNKFVKLGRKLFSIFRYPFVNPISAIIVGPSPPNPLRPRYWRTNVGKWGHSMKQETRTGKSLRTYWRRIPIFENFRLQPTANFYFSNDKFSFGNSSRVNDHFVYLALEFGIGVESLLSQYNLGRCNLITNKQTSKSYLARRWTQKIAVPIAWML